MRGSIQVVTCVPENYDGRSGRDTSFDTSFDIFKDDAFGWCNADPLRTQKISLRIRLPETDIFASDYASGYSKTSRLQSA